MSTAMQNSAQTSSDFIPGQHFLETFTLLSPNNQDHIFMDDDNVPVLNQQTRLLLHLWRPYLTHTFNNALTVPGQHFLETFTLLSPNNQDHIFMDDDNVPVLNQQTRLLLHLWRPYLTHTFNNALTVTLHISLKHLAAKIPSQLHISFFSSYETCSINVNPLFHAAIKNLHIKALRNLRLHPHLFTLKLSEETI